MRKILWVAPIIISLFRAHGGLQPDLVNFLGSLLFAGMRQMWSGQLLDVVYHFLLLFSFSSPPCVVPFLYRSRYVPIPVQLASGQRCS